MRFDDDDMNAVIAFFTLVIVFTLLFGWINHIFYCFDNGAWGFLIAGALFFPIGIIHGFYVLF